MKEVSDNPNTKDAIDYYDFVGCGRYTISGDTIKTQIIHKSHSLNDGWSGYERWYKIMDKNTLQCIETFYLTTDKREKVRTEQNYSLGVGEYSVFVPTEKIPPLSYYWIFKEKWFWCKEQDWKAYKEKIKQKKK